MGRIRAGIRLDGHQSIGSRVALLPARQTFPGASRALLGFGTRVSRMAWPIGRSRSV